jgi:phage gpG-like protein
MSGNVQWNGDDFKRRLHEDMARRLERAAIVVERHAKILLSVSGTGVKKGGKIVRKVKGMKGKNIYGAFPSAPGEPPRKQTGRLRASVTHEVDRAKLTARVGTNVKYARVLEFGGKHIAPRPWLRRALAESQSRIKEILGLK